VNVSEGTIGPMGTLGTYRAVEVGSFSFKFTCVQIQSRVIRGQSEECEVSTLSGENTSDISHENTSSVWELNWRSLSFCSFSAEGKSFRRQDHERGSIQVPISARP
jgi:hypothetical protein